VLPLSLYVHIPWCIRKCPYCDFNSHKSPDTLPERSYVQALLDDLTRDVSHYSKRPLTSIFIGGGTPSLFSGEAYEALFTGIKPLLPFADDIEITLEANPGTVDQHRFKDYRALGINRLSLGIQSFNASHLKALGRIHDDTQAHRAIDAARWAGFNNINIDIMHGLPNQTPEQGLTDLRTALSHQPEHLSWYQLTLEPNTVFYKTRPPLPSEEDSDHLEQQGLALLKQAGYHRYELSAFARDEKMARHNLNYWLFGDYYGIGAGAHGKLTSPKWHVHRTRKHRMPQEYLNPEKDFLAETTRLTTDDLIFEFMLNTTRLEQPIELKHFTERTGLPFDALKPQLLEAQNKGLVTLNTTHWQITPFGRRYTNDLQALFLHI
jgi:putative oxygen-independent coproporphyrinogen III oxidase